MKRNKVYGDEARQRTRRWLRTGLLIAGMSCLFQSGTCADELRPNVQPNVIVFVADDQGWGDLSCNGNLDLSTPNIDGLAKAGASLENFYVCPVCSPTRAEFLTGRYHPRGGVFSTSAGGERLDLDESTLAESFQAAGYRTAAFGKWHNGMQPPYHPNARGFDEFYGFCSGHWGHYFSPTLERNGTLVKGNGFVIDDFTNQAIKFIEKSHELNKPFFVYLPYNTPHSPMQVPRRFWEKFADKEISQPGTGEMPGSNPKKKNRKKHDIDHTRAALAMCENIDDNVGRVLKKLDQSSLNDNTIVVYFSDNGPNGWRFNGGMKGRKGSTDEGGIRSPFHIRWPGKIKPQTEIETVAGAIDLRSTLLGLCQVQDVPAKPLDGINLAAELLGGEIQPSDRLLFSHWNNRVSVRNQQFRLDNDGKLFDMVNDRNQTTPVTESHPAVTEKLKAAVAQWRTDVLQQIDRTPKPFTICHPDFDLTQLPARDATGTGEIKRSNRYPNDSFLMNWLNVEDEISWPVDVLSDGRYEVDLYYSCSTANIGTVMELSLELDSKLGEPQITPESVAKKIEVAHDPPLVGAGEDRAVRAESYVKEFRPIRMGVIEVKQGVGKLVLRAKEIPGKQSIDFQRLMFKRVAHKEAKD